MTRRRKVALAVLAALLLLIGIGAVWLLNGYDADLAAIAAFDSTIDPDRTVFGPTDAAYGFIFYPGGRVDHRAYTPLMKALAEQGILCVIVPMPADLAVLDMFADEDILDAYPDVEHWYIGGHSLGGTSAAIAVANWTVPPYDGIVLLGAYSAVELPFTMEALSVYGSEDRVMNAENYAQNRANLPDDFRELVIEGGNHAGFGMYGPQDGDGEASIPAAEQIEQTADAIVAMILHGTEISISE